MLYVALCNLAGFDPVTCDQPRDENGRWTTDGGSPPVLDWHEPPKPKASGKGGGGFSASGRTNTEIGDTVEALVQKMGLKSLLGSKRQNPLDAKLGAYGFEIKAVTTQSSEYKIKMKSSEIRSKVRYAKEHGFKPATMMVVLGTRKAWVYWTDGIKNGRLNKDKWKYMGAISV